MNKEIKDRTGRLRELVKHLAELEYKLQAVTLEVRSLAHKIGFEVGYLIGINENESLGG